MTLDTGATVDPIAAHNQWDEPVEVTFEKPTVLYFYPRDDTPGCTTEATQFDEIHDRFAEAGVSLYGVSTDDVQAHCEFAERHDLDFDLLADPDGRIAAQFDVPVDQDRVARTTFVCARQRVLGVYEGVRPNGHAREVLRDVAEAGLAQV